ncbi:MAG: TonB-dependent receptor [Methylobacter sp.]|uniref:TonB-dependent receptor n=1 Tax=Candidatus Methylobacter titanis TaxID=3053457 RepID=A0AA43Q2Y6_9GAMM|nr:TonB-dependent receptor [Candidatus Methylobacter titanis]MDI1292206.1 TonB-dependent receptor [Candidatus Methylobacter titanis]
MVKKIVFIVTALTGMTAQADSSITLEPMVVEDVSPPGNGLMTPQDLPQARSVISRAAIEQKNTLNNAYQAMDMLPGVNTYSYDATGLFGGGLRMRGFNSDQIGVSIDGVPINDAGNFAVYPSELVDLENLEEISVTQGSSTLDAPMVGATGGSIGMTTSSPTDHSRFRVQQSYGAYNAYKTFLRADSGYLGDNRFKAFISVSKAEAEKWKGYGGADREHLDFKGVFNLAPGSSITGGLLYNEMLNHNLRTLTRQEIQTLGRDADFGGVAPQHLAGVNGSAQVEKAPSDLYYNLNLNPYRNYLATLKGRFQLLPNLHWDVDPYYSYGYGTGGNQLRTLAESNAANKLGGGIRDINQDGDTLDTVMVYSAGLTETERPGVTTRLRSQIANHHLMVGYWFEYAHHRRSQPAVPFDNAGNSADPWLDNASVFLLRQDGTPYQGRDFLTLNTSQSFFGQDDIRFLDDKLMLSLGLRYTQIQRDFTNFASEGGGTDYNIKATYARPLPSVGIRYQFTEAQQVFVSRAENFKAPPDSVFYGLINGSRLKPVNVAEEVSTNWDLGYRYTGKDLLFSGTVFYIDYRHRIASAFDPANNISTNYNVGDSITKGVELESAYRFLPSWSVYASLTYTDSRIGQNLQTAANTVEATAGKAFPDVPNWMSGAALQYQDGPWSANLSAKYTGQRYATLVNDESINGYTLVSFDAGYRLPSTGWFKDPSVRLNVYNLLNQDYLNLDAGSGSGFTPRALGTDGRAPNYYVGAPRSFSVMLSTDF